MSDNEDLTQQEIEELQGIFENNSSPSIYGGNFQFGSQSRAGLFDQISDVNYGTYEPPETDEDMQELREGLNELLQQSMEPRQHYVGTNQFRESNMNQNIEAGTKTVLILGGPEDGQFRTIDRSHFEIVTTYLDEPLNFDPLEEPREEKTLVIDEDGNEKWIGWDSRNDPVETPSLSNATEIRYRVFSVVFPEENSKAFVAMEENPLQNGAISVYGEDLSAIVNASETQFSTQQVRRKLLQIAEPNNLSFDGNEMHTEDWYYASSDDASAYTLDVDGTANIATEDESEITEEEMRGFSHVASNLWNAINPLSSSGNSGRNG